jgi:hypothetical protein
MMLPSIRTLFLEVAVVPVLAIVAYVSRRASIVPYALEPGGTRDAEESDADIGEFKRVAYQLGLWLRAVAKCLSWIGSTRSGTRPLSR